MDNSTFVDNNIIITIDPITNLVDQCKFIPSINYDLRPDPSELDLLVIHAISLPPGEFTVKSEGYISDLFNNKLDPTIHPYFAQIHNLKLSSHCFINRNGLLIQYVPFNYRAWHAGISSFKGREHCNDFSIGIELEGTDNIHYTTKQYQILIPLIKAILKHFPKITPENILGHSDIAPGRKTDPGKYFDWDLIHKFIN